MAVVGETDDFELQKELSDRSSFIKSILDLPVEQTELPVGDAAHVHEAGFPLATYDQRNGQRQVLSAIVKAGETLVGIGYVPMAGPCEEDQFFATAICHPCGGRARFLGMLLPGYEESVCLSDVRGALSLSSEERDVKISYFSAGQVAISSLSDLIVPNSVITASRILRPEEREPLKEGYLWCAVPSNLTVVQSKSSTADSQLSGRQTVAKNSPPQTYRRPPRKRQKGFVSIPR